MAPQPSDASDRFHRAFTWLIQDEGEDFVNDPDDTGGPTKYGITQRAYTNWTHRPASQSDVADITVPEAATFYHEMYWLPLMGDSIKEEASAIAIFDIGVLLGLGRTVRLVQRICRVEQDGVMGPATLEALTHAAVGSQGMPVMLINEFIIDLVSAICQKFAAICQNEPAKLKFLATWLYRSTRLLQLI